MLIEILILILALDIHAAEQRILFLNTGMSNHTPCMITVILPVSHEAFKYYMSLVCLEKREFYANAHTVLYIILEKSLNH